MQPTIGDHIARHRRQSALTQEQLAEAAGVSVETIRKLEQGVKESARMATLNRIARALRVPTTSLLGNASGAAARREPDCDDVALLDIRQALTPARGIRGATVGMPDAAPPTAAGLRESIRVLDTAYNGDNYSSALAGLPLVLAEAQSLLAHAATDSDRHEALLLSAAAHQLAGTALTQIRAFDLGHRAISIALDAADAAGDDDVGASVVTTMCWLLLRQARFRDTEQLAVATADAIEPQLRSSSPERLAVWGWLMLRAAAAAVRDGRDDDAGELLDASAAAAARLGDRVPRGRVAPLPAHIGGFCTTIVAMKRVEDAIIAGEPGRALTLSESVRRDDPRPTRINRHRHLLDVAHAHTAEGRYGDATSTLTQVRAEAPAWLRHQRYARDIVSTIASARRRAVSQEFAELASLVGAEL